MDFGVVKGQFGGVVFFCVNIPMLFTKVGCNHVSCHQLLKGPVGGLSPNFTPGSLVMLYEGSFFCAKIVLIF